MEEGIGTFSGCGGYPLRYRYWRPPGARAALVVVHGIRSHAGWYVDSCSFLAGHGYQVYALDRRGSGLNDSERGHASSYRDVVRDHLFFIGSLRNGLPKNIMGISWGARIAAYIAAFWPHEVSNLILMTPGLASRVDVPNWRKIRILLDSLLRPGRVYEIPLSDSSFFTGDPGRRAFIDGDGLGLRRCTARFLYESNRLNRAAGKNLFRIRSPVLVMLAGKDRIVDNDRVEELMGGVKSEVSIRRYPNAVHTLEFEENRGEIFRDLLHWLDEHNKKPDVPFDYAQDKQ